MVPQVPFPNVMEDILVTHLSLMTVDFFVCVSLQLNKIATIILSFSQVSYIFYLLMLRGSQHIIYIAYIAYII